MCLSLILAGGIPPAASAQTADEAAAQLAKTARTPDEAAIQKVLLKGYEAYAKKDAAALFGLFSERSPHLPEFMQFIRENLASNEGVRIESVRILLVRNLLVEGDRATARLTAEVRAQYMDTGRAAEGFGEMDHTFRFVKEDDRWKIWQFAVTAEELTNDLLAATTDDERANLLATKGAPFTSGLLFGLLNQARILLEVKGSHAQAAIIFNLALHVGRQLASQLNEPLGVAGAMIGLGDVYSAQGDYQRAADNYQQVLSLAERVGSKEAVAAVSVKMGNIHYHQGNYAQAMEYYQRGAELYERLGSKLEIAYPFANIGNAYLAQGDHARAMEYYQRSLKIYEQVFDKAGTAYLLHRMGQVYASQGNHARAVENYQKSLRLHEELGNKAMAAYSLTGIGDVRYAQGDYEGAGALLTPAVEFAKIGDSPEVLWQALTSTGRVRRALNQPDRARQAFSEAIAVVEQLRSRVAGNEQDRQLFFESRTAPYYEMVDLLVAQNSLPEAFAYAERAKGRVLLDALGGDGRENITGALTPDERNEERRLDEAVNILNSQLRRESLQPRRQDERRVSDVEAQLKKARLEYEALQTRLYAAHPQLKTLRGRVEPLTLDGVAAVIPDTKTALLEFSVTREKVYLFVITKGTETAQVKREGVELKVYPLGLKVNELTTLVGEFRARLSNNTLNFREPARQLYDTLIRPARAQLEGKTTLCIVPDGVLWELPFQALQPGEDRYLLEDYALFYAPSLSVLREMKRRGSAPTTAADVGRADTAGASTIKAGMSMPSASRTLLAFGNPELGKPAVARAGSFKGDDPLAPLPEAEREVRSLIRFYNSARSKILTGKKAREETFKAEAGKYRVLHLATHGTLDDYNPMYSRLMLAGDGGNEDGFLEAREIINLKLGADLVVLSACQTARGRVGAGEGLIGMSWAFFVAGTPTTVASQWKVDSAGTTLLMTDFHRLLAAQESNGRARVNKAEALREAALKLSSNAQYRHPFYWAGFVVIGDGN